MDQRANATNRAASRPSTSGSGASASEQLAAILRGISAAYPRSEWTADTVSAYSTHLADLPAELVAAAARRWIQSERYPPTIADVRRVATDIRREVLELRRSRALLVDGAPDPDDPRVAAARARIGAMIRAIGGKA